MHRGSKGRAIAALIFACMVVVSMVAPLVAFGGIASATSTAEPAVAVGAGVLGSGEASELTLNDGGYGHAGQTTPLGSGDSELWLATTGSDVTDGWRLTDGQHRDYSAAVMMEPGREAGSLALQQTGPSTTVLGQDATFGFMELSSVFFGESGRIFGSNDVIAVSGVIPPSFFCPTSGKGIVNEPAPFPTADFYVINNTGEYLSDGTELEDVGAQPNRVVALSSGAFVDEVVAIAEPGGNLPPGEYDVVMDHCMNSVLDRSGGEMNDIEFLTGKYDIVLGDGPGYAFKVLENGSVAENLPEMNTHPVKQSAKTMALGLGGPDIEDPVTGEPVPTGFCGLSGDLSDQSESGASTLLGALVPKCKDMVTHYEGIAADPPRSDYDQLAEVGPVDYDFSPTETPLERATQRLSNRFAEQAAITEALLITMERFQGAKEADDHTAMVRQLERMDELIELLIGPGGNLYRTYAALEAFDHALADDPELGGTPEAEALRAQIPELRRSIGSLLTPLGPELRRKVGEDRIEPQGLQAWIIVYQGEIPSLADEGLPGIPQLRAAQGLPPLSPDHPTAGTTGPYTAPPGRLIEFDASPSEDPNGDSLTFEWDLDGDGAFDDGNGITINESFEDSGIRLIGVKTRDPDGNTDVHYTQLRIGDLTTQDVVVTHGGTVSNRTLWRVTPDGNVSVIRDDARVPGNIGGFQVDVNGDIVVATSGFGSGVNSVIQRFDEDGSLVRTITQERVENLTGREITRFGDLVIDGRGDLIVLAPTPDSEKSELLLRIAPDGSRASIILDGVQDEGHSRPLGGLAIDPEGNIVVTGKAGLGLNDKSDLQRIGQAVLVVDPEDGSFETVIPPSQWALPDDRVGHLDVTFGGSELQPLGGGLGVGGVAVDARGDYVMTPGSSAFIYRVPTPPQLSVRRNTSAHQFWDLEIFPTPVPHEQAVQDINLDRGGDVLVAGTDLERKGVWRITPAGGVFKMADLGEHQSGRNPARLGVKPEIRRVTAKDVEQPPRLRISGMRIDKESCPGSADIGVTVENSGAASATPPIRVDFFDGDPLTDGVIIGSASVDTPVAPGESVDLDITWSEPAPGAHEVYARVAGASANSPSAALRVCGAESLSYPLTVEPGAATNTVGHAQTFEANVTVLGDPVAGVPIIFEVTGANPVSDTVTTDETGIATFTYTGTKAGVDTVVATIASATVVGSDPATVTWQEQANRPPVTDAGGPYEVDEGDTLTLNGTGSSDPDGDDLTYTWAFEGQAYDGAVVEVPVADDLETTATLTITDGRGGADTATANVTVSNVAPNLTAGADLTADEGSTVTLSASFADPGVEDAPWTVTWNFGDGSDPFTVFTDSQGALATNHVYLDDGEYEAEVCVTDKDGETGCDSLVVTILNVPPKITDLNRSADAIDEGENVTLSGTFTDPGVLDAHQVLVDWGDEMEETLNLPLEARKFAVNHTYHDNQPDDAPYPISVTVVDDDDGQDNDTTQLTVRNVAPKVTALTLSNGTIEEGEEVTLVGEFTDPGILDTHEVTLDWGDGSDPERLELPQGDREFSASHRYLDNPPGKPKGSFTISVTVTDKDGGEGSNTTTVQVLNVAPDVSATGDAIDEGETATVEATFTDPGIIDTHTTTVDWGDGTPPETVTVEQGAGSGSLTATRSFGDDGTYTVTVTVTDDDGGVGSTTTVVDVKNVAPSADLNTSDVIAFHGKDAFLGRVGVEQAHEASAIDPGSDDLTFTWDFDVNSTSSTYFNDGEGPDPDLSPGGTFPFWATDTSSVTFDAPGVYTLSVAVTDDDGGLNATSQPKVVTGDADDVRSMGFWRHQYSGQGRAHYEDDELEAFLDIANYASGVFSEERNASTFDAAHDVLTPSGPGMRNKAEAQALAAWLNFAAGGVGWTEEIDTDGDGTPDRAFNDVISEVEGILTDSKASEADLERAKDLAEAINTGGGDTGEGTAGGSNNDGVKGNGR